MSAQSTICQTWTLPGRGLLVVQVITDEPLKSHEVKGLQSLMECAHLAAEMLTPPEAEA